jgi:hypothetical protein
MHAIRGPERPSLRELVACPSGCPRSQGLRNCRHPDRCLATLRTLAFRRRSRRFRRPHRGDRPRR